MIRRVAIAILAVTAAAPATAASFDCARAAGADERAVCASRALNDRDVVMALLYRLDRGFVAMGGRGALEDEQRGFLAARGRCGDDGACLTRLYHRRIDMLQRIIDERVKTRGPF